jgi:hypothetical protein
MGVFIDMAIYWLRITVKSAVRIPYGLRFFIDMTVISYI